MKKSTVKNGRDTVDKTLIVMFLRMSPEERLKANDNAIRAILELRNAYKHPTNVSAGSERDH